MGPEWFSTHGISSLNYRFPNGRGSKETGVTGTARVSSGTLGFLIRKTGDSPAPPVRIP